MVDLHTHIPESTHFFPRQGLDHHLCYPPTRESLLNRFRVLNIKINLTHSVELGGNASSCHGVSLALGISIVDDFQGFQDFLNRLDASVRPPCLLLLTIVLIDIAELALLLMTEVLANSEDGQIE